MLVDDMLALSFAPSSLTYFYSSPFDFRMVKEWLKMAKNGLRLVFNDSL